MGSMAAGGARVYAQGHAVRQMEVQGPRGQFRSQGQGGEEVRGLIPCTSS